MPLPKHVAVTGSSGLVGRALLLALHRHTIPATRVVRRRPTGADGAFWDPVAGVVDTEAVASVDAVVHLAGEAVARRWTRARRRRIRDSRVRGTRVLCEALAGMESPPKTLVCASAIGWYGSRGDDELTEDSGPGEGFLADVCREWEGAADAARAAGIRVVHLRIGMVLAWEGGALGRMRWPFLLGLGGPMGSGQQWVSWVSREDLVRMILFALRQDQVEGVYNAVSPHPVRNRDFARAVAKALGRPCLLPAPAMALRLAFTRGMADEILLCSQRVLPARFTGEGFEWGQELNDCLARALHQRKP